MRPAFTGHMLDVVLLFAAPSAALGARYTSYAAGRKRLIPYVW